MTTSGPIDNLTDRQRRELEYHKNHAASLAGSLGPVNFSVISSTKRRWWNAYWSVWALICNMPLVERTVLVVGCGAGDDALYFAKLGAFVRAFDLSHEMLALAKRRAAENGLSVSFEQMPAERMNYPDASFDLIFARDILHHVDIAAAMGEIVRVSKPGAVFVMDEIYSHTITDAIRHSWLVERLLYRRMSEFIYKREKPYITDDERKMSQRDVAKVIAKLSGVRLRRYFNFVVTRLVPDKSALFNKLDRIALMALGPIGYFVAGRIVLVGIVKKR